MLELSHFQTVVLLFAGIFLTRKVIQRIRHRSIVHLPGPPSDSWLVGNLPAIFRAPTAWGNELEWTKEYGHAMHVKGVCGEDILHLSDPKGLQYVFNTAGHNFKKPASARMLSKLVVGEGVSFVEGEDHSRQRRIMIPSFHFSTLRNFLPRFRLVAHKTAQKWSDAIQSGGGSSVLEMTSWLSKATLDAMGETAFDYKFDTLDEGHDDLSKAYSNLLTDTTYRRPNITLILEVLWGRLPYLLVCGFFKYLPSRQFKRFRSYMSVARSVASEIVDEQKKGYDVGKEGSKDVMSILIRANISENPKTRLTDDSLMAQMTTLMFAGHDTTASTLSWVFYELARRPEVQQKLRQEIREMKKQVSERGDLDLSVADVDSMKYLSAIIKETLRFHPIVSIIQRESEKDDVIPLSYPVKTKTGDIITTIPVSKGQRVFVSLVMYNLSKTVWGNDADQWRPERFLESDQQATIPKTALGVISNIATFGSGRRSCIGWRFAMTEMQTLLIEFIDNFEFAPVPGKSDIIAGPTTVIFPMVEGEEGRNQLPLLVSPAPAHDSSG